MSLLGPAQTAFLPQDAYRRDDGAPPLDVHTAGEHEPPDAFDQGLFLEHLRALRAGHPARPPASSSMARRRGGRTVLREKRRLGGPEQAHERLGQGTRPSAAEATADADEERPTQGVGERAHKRR
jgi:hypothetical protein